MGEKKKNVYDESKIQTLSPLEHIRLRSGMYIGRLGDGSNRNDGIYILLKEVIDNSVDEFIMGNGSKIAIEIAGSRVKVRDYGRGIPLGKVVECVSVINTGAKYNDDVFQFSVGLNGVGTKAVNALSSYFKVMSVRGGKCAEAGANILDVSQSVMKEFFSMVMVVEIDNMTVPFATFVDTMKALGEESGLEIHTMHEDIFAAMHKI